MEGRWEVQQVEGGKHLSSRGEREKKTGCKWRGGAKLKWRLGGMSEWKVEEESGERRENGV